MQFVYKISRALGRGLNLATILHQLRFSATTPPLAYGCDVHLVRIYAIFSQGLNHFLCYHYTTHIQ